MLKYRADIDGLRAIAVLSVVGFHAFPGRLRGGFVGVDIFFVISGFLISGIIFKGVEQGNFNYIDFYTRRIKRIFPALIIVLTFCLIFGWLTMLPNEYRSLGKHAAAGASFISNIAFWSESSYFDSAAELKPLLHLWSLGIEEQFYIFYPVFISLFYNRIQKKSLSILVVLFVSFLLNIGLIRSDPVATFYLPGTRFWELLIGSLLASLTISESSLISKKDVDPAATKIIHEIMSLFGLMMIMSSILLINRDRAFPGWWALLPTLGTFFLIAAGSEAWFNRKVLASRVFVFFGLISYPLYLWHWPVLVFLKLNDFGITASLVDRVTRLTAVLVSIFLSWITYKLIEKPIRFGSYTSRKLVAIISIIFVIYITGILIKGHIIKGTYDYTDEYVSYFENSPPYYHYMMSNNIPTIYRDDCNFYDYKTNLVKKEINKNCYTTKDANKIIFIWGDSNAQHLNYGLEKALSSNMNLLQVATSACHPTIEALLIDPFLSCNKSNKFAIQTIDRVKPDLVILAQLDNHEATDWGKITNLLKSIGVKKVLLLGPVPQWTSPLYKVIAKKYWENTPERIYTSIRHDILNTDRLMKSKYSTSINLKYLSLIDNLCSTDGCLAYIGNNRKDGIFTFDTSHLTSIGSAFVAKYILAPVIEEKMGM